MCELRWPCCGMLSASLATTLALFQASKPFSSHLISSPCPTPYLHSRVVSTDALRDAARLSRCHPSLAQVIQQRSLSVIHMAHDRDNWGPRHQIINVFLGHEIGLLLGSLGHGLLLLLHHLRAGAAQGGRG